MSAQDTYFSSNYSLNIKGELFDLSTPKVMGILNLTPDSFYDGGQNNTKEKALQKMAKMLEEGADIIDMGAASSRPGAEIVSSEEELSRLLPILEEALLQFPKSLISIDTFHSSVAKKCIEAGAHMINDISGGDMDSQMFPSIAELKCPYILMHMQGTPQNMQDKPAYDNVLVDVYKELQGKVLKAKEAGLIDIIVDPGMGFGKTVEQNFKLLNQLRHFEALSCPMLIGLSRKSMIYKSLNNTADEALNGTTALNMVALENGANILRVHDVKEAKECIELFNKLKAQ